MVAIGVATAAALGVMVVAVKARYRTMADESFRRAEELFQSGAFTKAQQEFDFFGTEYSNDPRTKRAKLAAELSKVAQSIDDELADPHRVIESLEEFAADSRDSRSEASVQERWPVILMMAERSARSRLEKASQSLAAADLESGDTWLRWLHDQQNAQADGAETLALAELDQLSAKARDAIAVEGRRLGFLIAADRALADGTAAQFADAFRAYDQWRASSAGNDPTIAATHDRLRLALRNRVRFESPPQSGETADSVPVLPVDAYTRLSTRTQHKTVTVTSTRPVFARAKDLCFALEPPTGVVRWVLRVGYDAPLPEVVAVSGRQLVVVPWFSGAEPMISLCNAATGESIWSWKSPDLLTGPSVVTRDSIFAATVGGSIWQLDFETGTPRGVAELPEPIDSPLTPREDGRGFCVVGSRQAVYLFDTSGEQPQCTDLALFGRRPGTAHCQVMWVPPYVVIFENDLMNRCYVRVLFQESNGLRQIRQLEAPLDGRVWQQPVMDGADIFVMTDRFKIHCFGLDPGDSAINLYQAATALKPPPSLHQPTRPQLARVTELPFVALSDAMYGYRVDRSQGLLREVWNRALPHSEARAVQPLQAVGGLVVANFQEPARDGVLVHGIDATRGELVWETRLANTARDVTFIYQGRGSIQSLTWLARTDSEFFSISSTPESRRVLSLPTPSSKIHPIELFFPDESAYASDGGTRLQRFNIHDLSVKESLAQNPPIRSEISIIAGITVDPGTQREEHRDGRWAAFVSEERTFVIRPIDGGADDIHEVRLPPANGMNAEWCLLPCTLEPFFVAHPTGVLCRIEARKTDGITHLFLAEQRTDLPRPAAAPIDRGDFIFWPSQNGRCLLLDRKTLRTAAEWQAPSTIRECRLGFERRTYLGLGKSGILALRIEEDKFAIDWQRELGGADWFVSSVASKSVIATNSVGEIRILDSATGEIKETIRAPAPLVLPPIALGNLLALATVDGGLHFVSLSNAP